ncbi:RRM domain-containing protein [Entamoeba marina]
MSAEYTSAPQSHQITSKPSTLSTVEYTTTFPSNPLITIFPTVPQCITCDEACSCVYVSDEFSTLRVYDPHVKKILHTTTLPPQTKKIIVSPQSTFLIGVTPSSIRIFRILSPFRLLEIDSIPDVDDAIFIGDCLTSPLSFLTRSHNQTTITHYRYDNGVRCPVKTKTFPFPVSYFSVSTSYSQIVVAHPSYVVVLDKDFITIFEENLPFKIAGAAFANEKLFVLAGFSVIPIIDKEAKEINLPTGELLLQFKGHSNHLIVADSRRLFVIDCKVGKVSFLSEFTHRSACLYDFYTNAKMNIFVCLLYGLPLVMTIISDEILNRPGGLLQTIPCKDTKVHLQDIPVFQTAKQPETNSVPASIYSVFVGRFNDISPEEVQEVFQQNFGSVLRVRPFPGHCFVDFKEESSMAKALKHNTFLVGEKQVTINPAQRNTTKHGFN